jgi:hypothetical protein
MTFTQLFRVRLRRAARLASQLAELFDFLGFAFAAQLARTVFFAALLALFLVDLVARTTLRLAVFTFRFMALRLQRLTRAFLGLGLAALLAFGVATEASDMLWNHSIKYGLPRVFCA